MDASRQRMAVMPPDQTSSKPRERETIEELFAALESPLLHYALRLVGELSAAEDVVQEAFVKLHAQFEEVREPRRWLYRTAHNLALNHRRDSAKIISLSAGIADHSHGSSKSNETHEIDVTDVTDEAPLPDEQIARWEGIGLVRLSLETLDERSREVVRLKFNENMSYKEIAARTGLKIGNVGYLLHHALKQIADELAKNGIVS
jgi:RNA polymerase sigma-70 factor (ECF subfamily)